MRCAIEISEALAAAHAAGIVHRDLKPGNIILTRTGAKLLDFGLAKPRREPPTGMSDIDTQQPITGAGAMAGTLQYMSPEQVEGREADARSDIFALGAVVYEMVTSRRPFDGRSQASLIAAILYADPPAPSSIVPTLSTAFDYFVRCCLSKNPDDRWQAAHDVLLELRWLEQERLLVSPPAEPGAAPRRNAGWFVALAVSLIAFAAIALLLRPGPADAPRHRARFDVALPDSLGFDFPDWPVVSPSGDHLVFTARLQGQAATVDAIARRHRSAAGGHRGGDVPVLVAGQPSRGVLLGWQAETGGCGWWSRDGAQRRLQREPGRMGRRRYHPVRPPAERGHSRCRGGWRSIAAGHPPRRRPRRNGPPVSALPARRAALPVRGVGPAAGRLRHVAGRRSRQANLPHVHRHLVCCARVPAVQQATEPHGAAVRRKKARTAGQPRRNRGPGVRRRLLRVGRWARWCSGPAAAARTISSGSAATATAWEPSVPPRITSRSCSHRAGVAQPCSAWTPTPATRICGSWISTRRSPRG